VALLPMVLSGALVPLAVASVHRPEQAVGRTLGRIYAANALGSVSGALLAGFALIPLLGCRRTSLLLFGLQVLFGTLLLAGEHKRVSFRLASVAAGLVLVALGAALVPSDLFYRRYAGAAPSEQPVYFSEGRVVTTLVTRNRAGNLTLYLNGIPEVINDRPALRTFRLMALLPYLMHPDPRDALMITFGAGISAGLAVHLYPQVTCVELNETCRQVARIFRRENGNVLDAENLSLEIDDGRNFLLHTRERYAAIISDATHPHSYDSWILFTREFYQLCVGRLDHGGVFCQWLPLHGLAPQQFRTILNTVQAVFPAVNVWVVDGAYCLMLAGEHPLRMDPQRLAETLNRSDLRPFLSPVGLDNPYAILSCFVADRAGLKPLLENESLLNTDDRPYNQFFPLAVTGFDRLRWHVDNLRRITQFRRPVSLLMEPGTDLNREHDGVVTRMGAKKMGKRK
jgi:spermidine synthase